MGSGVEDKGLKKNAIGFASSVVIGVASTAPGYSLAATLGFVTAVVGTKAPAILLISFVPMFLVAAGYYYMNKADPDCGTSFTWVARVLGKRTGWLTGRGYNFFVHRSNRLLLGFYLPWGSNMALPRAIWQKVQKQTCHRTDVHEDLDLGLHLHASGYQVRYLPWLRVGAVARRIMSDRQLLWPYLIMWPRTFRIHNISRLTSFLTWVTAGIVWMGSYGVYITEHIARRLTRKPIDY